MKFNILTSTVVGLICLGQYVVAEDLLFPIVGAMQNEGVVTHDFWDHFEAQVLFENDGTTTYSASCTSECDGLKVKATIAPNTYIMDVALKKSQTWSLRSACTFTGSPATAAACEVTALSSVIMSGVTNSVWSLTVAEPTCGSQSIGSQPTGSQTTGSPIYTIATGTVKIAEGTANGGAAQRTGMPRAGWILGVGVAAGAMFGV